MAKKFNIKKLGTHAGRIAIILFVIFLTTYLISLISESTGFYTSSAERSAEIYFSEDMERAGELAKQHYENLYALVDQLAYAETKAAVDEVIQAQIGSELFGDLRYYSQGTSYSPTGAEVGEEMSGQEYIKALSEGNVAGCSPVYYNEKAQCDCIAFFVPIRGSAVIDGILSIVPAKDIIRTSDVINEKTSVVAVVRADGKVLTSISSESFKESVGADLFNFMDKLTDNNKETVDSVRSILKKDRLSICHIEAKGTQYTVVAEPIDVFDGHLSLLSISPTDGLIVTEVAYIRHITNILVLSMGALAVGLVYAYLFKKKTNEALSVANTTDPILECSNVEGFRRKAMNLVFSRTNRYYAVGVFSIRQFHFLEDKLGAEDATEVLKFICYVFDTFCGEQETYGYAGDGRFLVLSDYESQASLRDKIVLLENMINKYELLQKNKIRIKFAIGICTAFEGKRKTIPEMIDCASTVSDRAKNDVKLPFVKYTETIREEIHRDGEIEAQMESALENNEFRLFLQPKYNAKGDCIDSAEALTRWFDPKKGDYIYPVQFISLFEANGFIVKLDHFIYLEVLKYFEQARERGDKVVPISVNVSRVTASASDFINFYVGNKKKYQVEDGLITLEFTESFAMDDNDKLAKIVEALHADGIRCSIDDFGVGYSSFSILKGIPMDELKLDRLFLSPGSDAGRDAKLYQTIVSLAQQMGMQLVQEGVENKEMFDRVVGMGIEVIQGYYYAKAIPLEEYKIFIKSNTAIKYKAAVK